jgi:hypothetical protein
MSKSRSETIRWSRHARSRRASRQSTPARASQRAGSCPRLGGVDKWQRPRQQSSNRRRRFRRYSLHEAVTLSRSCEGLRRDVKSGRRRGGDPGGRRLGVTTYRVRWPRGAGYAGVSGGVNARAGQHIASIVMRFGKIAFVGRKGVAWVRRPNAASARLHSAARSPPRSLCRWLVARRGRRM